MHAAPVFGRATRFAEETTASTSTEPQGSGTWMTLGIVLKGFLRDVSSRWDATKYECSSWNGFGVQTSIGRITGRDARGSSQEPTFGYARPSSKETPGARA